MKSSAATVRFDYFSDALQDNFRVADNTSRIRRMRGDNVSITAKSGLSNARVPGLNCPETARRRVDADRKSKHANIPRDMIASGSTS